MNFPFVSVLIPVKNEENNILKCLKQLVHQTYGNHLIEIIIIDAHSEDNTLNILFQFKKEFPTLNIRVLADPYCQRSSGLNEGIRNSKGEVILRIDARTIIPDDYIENCVKTLIQTGADNVGGVQKPIQSNDISDTQWSIGCGMAHPFGVGNAQFRLGKKSGYVDSVYLGCFQKKIFENVGFFDEHSTIISEDSDINYRIRKQGGKVYLDKNIIAYYLPRERFSDLIKLYFRYGGARAGFLLKWKCLTGYRQFIPPFFLVLMLILPGLAFFSSYFIDLWIILGVTYFIVNMIVSSLIIKKNKKNIRLLPKLMAVFPVMHFCWAGGFWLRLFQGRNNYRWN